MIVQTGLVVVGMMAPWAAGANISARKKRAWFSVIPRIPTQSSTQRSARRSELKGGISRRKAAARISPATP